jgi:hypothetical protein
MGRSIIDIQRKEEVKPPLPGSKRKGRKRPEKNDDSLILESTSLLFYYYIPLVFHPDFL